MRQTRTYRPTDGRTDQCYTTDTAAPCSVISSVLNATVNCEVTALHGLLVTSWQTVNSESKQSVTRPSVRPSVCPSLHERWQPASAGHTCSGIVTESRWIGKWRVALLVFQRTELRVACDPLVAALLVCLLTTHLSVSFTTNRASHVGRSRARRRSNLNHAFIYVVLPTRHRSPWSCFGRCCDDAISRSVAPQNWGGPYTRNSVAECVTPYFRWLHNISCFLVMH